MIIEGFLVIGKKTRYSRVKIVRVTVNKPARAANELAVKLRLELPNDVFEDVVPELNVSASIDSILTPGIKASVEALTDDGLVEIEGAINSEILKRTREAEEDER